MLMLYIVDQFRVIINLTFGLHCIQYNYYAKHSSPYLCHNIIIIVFNIYVYEILLFFSG